jgi:hypothetical protein
MKSKRKSFQFIFVEAAFVVPADVGVDATHREVHFAQPPSRVIRLLPVDGDVTDAPAVAFDKLFRLHKHAARAAAGVVDSALVRLQHLDEHSHHRAWRVELAAALSFRTCEAAEEVFVYAAKDVLRLVVRLAHCDTGDQVDKLADHHLVERWAVVVLWQHPLEAGVVRLDRSHRVVDQLTNRRLLCVRLQMRPARLLRHPEHVFGEVFVRVFNGCGVFGE